MESLSANEIDTWETFTRNIQDTIYHAVFMKFKLAKDLFNTKQLASQSVVGAVFFMQDWLKTKILAKRCQRLQTS